MISRSWASTVTANAVAERRRRDSLLAEATFRRQVDALGACIALAIEATRAGARGDVGELGQALRIAKMWCGNLDRWVVYGTAMVRGDPGRSANLADLDAIGSLVGTMAGRQHLAAPWVAALAIAALAIEGAIRRENRAGTLAGRRW